MELNLGLNDRALEVAVFRYRLIADAIDAGTDGMGLMLRSIAGAEHLDTRGCRRRFVVRTLWRYVRAYRKGGLQALAPACRKDRGTRRKLGEVVFEQAKKLRLENPSRPTKSVIDILVRKKMIARGELARATLDRHLDFAGLSRRRLNTLGKKTYRKIATDHPFELVVIDFHHGPYVRDPFSSPDSPVLRKALLCAFIDHYSRYVPEGRYYLHEDFVALRFGFRRVLTGFGLMGHLKSMVLGSRVVAKVYLSAVPILPGTWDLLKQGIVPGGTYRNLHGVADSVGWHPDMTEEQQLLLCDAQTSGGLLISVPEARLEPLLSAMKSAGVPVAAVIGKITEGPPGRIQVFP